MTTNETQTSSNIIYLEGTGYIGIVDFLKTAFLRAKELDKDKIGIDSFFTDVELHIMRGRPQFVFSSEKAKLLRLRNAAQNLVEDKLTDIGLIKQKYLLDTIMLIACIKEVAMDLTAPKPQITPQNFRTANDQTV